MAYALRYYKEFTHPDGSVIRLEIHKKDSTASAMEIGAVVQGLSLQIQGQQGDVDSPIVKTSLSMTFVDAYDIENGQKNGFWEEFYTPDSVLWKVIVMAKDASESSFRTIWGGYVTPDSFSENLAYHGRVNIIARDNIGHLQDFPFDIGSNTNGLISLYDLVNAGWAKIESPMSLDWRGEEDESLWLESNGVVAYETLMNVSAFEGMNWYEAIEKALYSYGCVIRYVGNNRVQVSSLRYMPYHGRTSIDALPHIEPIFERGAQRELIPAARRIEESIKYDLEISERMPMLESLSFTGESVDCPYISVNAFGETETVQIPVHPISNISGYGWSNIPSSTLFFNAKMYSVSTNDYQLQEERKRMIYLAGNTDGSRMVTFRQNMLCIDSAINIKFGSNCIRRYGSTIMYAWNTAAKKVSYYITAVQDGVTQYLGDSSWQSDVQRHEIDIQDHAISIRLPLSELGGQADIAIHIEDISLDYKWDVSNGDGIYVPIESLSLAMPDNYPLLETNNVNTKYLDSNNIVLSRDPEFGPAYNSVILPSFIKNGIFYRNGISIFPASTWSWHGGAAQQMAVYNHLQLLCYYAKPNNLISGTIVNADITRVAAIYQWGGREHMLVSGTFNFLSGFLESAMLREFTRYDDMWSEASSAEMPSTEETSQTNVESGSSSSSTGTSYTNTTTVNIGSGGGGGGASYLNDLLDVNVESAPALSVLWYNGTEWVARQKDVLFEGYATEDYVDEQIEALNVRVTANEGEIESIKTKDAEQDATIEGIDARVTINEGEIEDMSALREWYANVGVHFLKDDGGIYTEENFRSTGEISAGGAGEEGSAGDEEGGIYGIKVNGESYTDYDGDGYVEIPDYPTSLEWSEIENRPTDLGDFTNEAGYLKSADIEGKADATDVTALDSKYSALVAELQESDSQIVDDIIALKEKDAEFDATIEEMSDIRAWYTNVGVHIGKDEDGIYTEENFRSTGEISAGGAGEEGEGGGGGADNLDGLLDVTISDYVPSTEDLTDDEHDAEKDSQVLGYDNASGQWVNKKTMYIHNQSTASAKWVITHNLGKMPNIKVIDSTGALVHGTVVYDTTDIMNKVTISFGGTFSGKAYLD